MSLFRFILNMLAVFILSCSFALVLCLSFATNSWARLDFDPKTQTGVRLFYSSNFKEAAQALEPSAKGGDLEALMLVLIMRQNGLDGQAPTIDLRPYNNILTISQPILEERLKDGSLARHKAGAYNYALARIHYFALAGGKADVAKAKRLAARAADLGFVPALNFSAYISDQQKRNAEAAFSIEEAAKKGDRLAMYNLGLFYREGRNFAKDDLKAAHWLRQSCNYTPGFARAQNDVGFMYETGRGVTQDSKEAKKWFKLAAEQGYEPAQINLKLKSGQTPQIDTSLVY